MVCNIINKKSKHIILGIFTNIVYTSFQLVIGSPINLFHRSGSIARSSSKGDKFLSTISGAKTQQEINWMWRQRCLALFPPCGSPRTASIRIRRRRKKNNSLGKSGKFIMLSRFHGDENASVYASVSCAETREADRMVPVIYGFCKAFALFIAVYFNRKRLLGGRIDTLEMWLTSCFRLWIWLDWVRIMTNVKNS